MSESESYTYPDGSKITITAQPVETLEQIAERAAEQINALAAKRYSIATTAMVILAALREVEARGEQRGATLGGALLDSAIEHAENAEAEIEHLKAVEADSLYE